ncbi:hypothetical protein V1J52_00805 [Streptomyces sp. TRM 70351]|uniref:hypothetical protein n=1 Tax=Streptomyces sp. TRM 70351 TaxID=3116552 RepID=UPI002E7AB1BA|nr:hypothetical protein [Streptomyces sp. TRM 70351]MEE1926733.1 hypothetical protein [Streptomyces sp. TRM 70351]
MGAGDTEHLNAWELYRTQNRTEDLDGLSAMRERFVEIAAVDGIFGRVGNGAAAEAALTEAATAMLAEAERAGISVANIAHNAGVAGGIAEMTDEEAAFQQRLTPPSGGGGFAEVY